MKVLSGVTREYIRVLVADSNQTQSQLLSSALRRQPGMKVTCCHGELADCLHAMGSAPVDVALLGVRFTDHDRLLETLRVLHVTHPHVNLILLLDSYDRALVVNAMRAGARGLFCSSRQPFRALCRCISVVHQGQFWVNTEQMGYVIEAASSTPSARVVLNAKGEGLLTPREEQVVTLVAEGIGNRGIAQQLGIKENTVKKALLRIYDKLGVSNRVELVLYALTYRGIETGSARPWKHVPVTEQHAPDRMVVSSEVGAKEFEMPAALGQMSRDKNSSYGLDYGQSGVPPPESGSES
jgi:two-component system, NarL family, response regulator DegU